MYSVTYSIGQVGSIDSLVIMFCNVPLQVYIGQQLQSPCLVHTHSLLATIMHLEIETVTKSKVLNISSCIISMQKKYASEINKLLTIQYKHI